jgi:hypothetical protein
MKRVRTFRALGLFAFATIGVVVAFGAASGCGGKNKCGAVTCSDPFTTCDPTDGVCKCGGYGGTVCPGATTCDVTTATCRCGGQGGITCPDGFDCDPVAIRCVSPNCDNKTCAQGMSCDLVDGRCKCGGSGGVACGSTELCDSSTRHCVSAPQCVGVTCASGTCCDPADGTCKCGADRVGTTSLCQGAGTLVTCPAYQACVNKQCVQNKCVGVTCTGGTACDPADGKCKCNGVACAFGQACGCGATDGGTGDAGCADSQKTCVGQPACASVRCAGNTTCDPADGACKCGGPGGTICADGQTCDVSLKRCTGTDYCAGVTCAGRTQCDPKDGICKCGGLGGKVCQASDGGVDQVCAAIGGTNQCIAPCDPRMQTCTGTADGGVPSACYFDSAAQVAYCAPAGTLTDGRLCQNFNDCVQGFQCLDSLTAKLCRRYCAVGQAGTCPAGRYCLQIVNAPSGVGACQ